eukprot:TRINITY_DN9079_c0_g1_i1.p1 TRINITY_DN9079_c0_g1~~TRINITY_DN9079_c0_g1_i1.p1  ORF type:complete len:198 (-),score=22.73 TRINITY_DN9079_c0_g1_i1:146-739(-)
MMTETPSYATMAMPGQQNVVYVFNSEAGQWQPVVAAANEPVFYVIPENFVDPSLHHNQAVSETQPFLIEDEDEENHPTIVREEAKESTRRPHKDVLLWLSCATAAFASGLLGALLMFLYSCDKHTGMFHNGMFAVSSMLCVLGCMGCFVASRKSFVIAERFLAWCCFVFGSMQVVLWMMTFFVVTQQCSFNPTPNYL